MGPNAIQRKRRKSTHGATARQRQHFMHANKSLYAHALTVGRNKIKNALARLHQSSLHSWSYARGKLVWPRRRETQCESAYHDAATTTTLFAGAPHQTYLGLKMQSSMHIPRWWQRKMELVHARHTTLLFCTNMSRSSEEIIFLDLQKSESFLRINSIKVISFVSNEFIYHPLRLKTISKVILNIIEFNYLKNV